MFELKQQIIEIINNSGLTVEMLLFVLKDIYHEAENLYREMIIKGIDKPITTEDEGIITPPPISSEEGEDVIITLD